MLSSALVLSYFAFQVKEEVDALMRCIPRPPPANPQPLQTPVQCPPPPPPPSQSSAPYSAFQQPGAVVPPALKGVCMYARAKLWLVSRLLLQKSSLAQAPAVFRILTIVQRCRGMCCFPKGCCAIACSQCMISIH